VAERALLPSAGYQSSVYSVGNKWTVTAGFGSQIILEQRASFNPKTLMRLLLPVQ
jgi:hypothetical protein